MRFVSRLVALTLALLLVLGGAGTVFAQSTPEAGTPTSGTPAAGSRGGPAIGTDVTILDADTGDKVATISVDKVTDPFNDYSQYSKPDRGNRFVAVDYTITNTGSDSFDNPAYDLSLATTDGELLTSTYVQPKDGSTVKPLATDAIKAGDSISGTLFYLVSNDLTVGGLVYAGSGHYTALASVDGLPNPAIGDTITISDTSGNDLATASVTQYIDPFKEYDQYSKPDRGNRDVAVTVKVTNTSGSDLDVSSYTFSLQTSEGLLYSTAYVQPKDGSKVTPFADGTVADGDSISGTIFFMIPDNVEVTGIFFQPDSGIMVNLGNPNA